MTWARHSRDEYHSTHAGYGVVAWPTGWAVYGPNNGPILLRGKADDYEQAQSRSMQVAGSLRRLRPALERREEVAG